MNYISDVIKQNNYYPFGMLLPNRHEASNEYRYGFNGMEKDDEISGEGNSYTAEYWQYDSRLGRRWNRDPVVKVHESPYVAFANNPLIFRDPDGADTIIAIHYQYQIVNGIQIKTYSATKMEQTSEKGSKLIFQIYDPGANSPTAIVNGFKSATNPNGLSTSSGAGAALYSDEKLKDGTNQKLYANLFNYGTGDKTHYKRADGGVTLNHIGFELTVRMSFKPNKVDLADLENYTASMGKLKQLADLLNNDFTISYYAPQKGDFRNVTIRPGTYEVNIAGFHSPEPSDYVPQKGSAAESKSLKGNDALDVNRADAVKEFLKNSGVKNIIVTTSGGVSKERKVIISK